MRLFPIKSFLCSGLVLLAVSCKTYQLTDVSPIALPLNSAENLYFSSTEDYVYRCQIDVYSNHLTGILIVKKLGENRHRVVLTSDFGNKLIDFELSENDFVLYYVVPDLDKKMVKNFLKKDFQLLLKKNYPVSKAYTRSGSTILVSEAAGQSTSYLFFGKDSQLLQQLVYTENGKEKIDFSFEAKRAIFADVISIQHKNFKIHIRLTQITDV